MIKRGFAFLGGNWDLYLVSNPSYTHFKIWGPKRGSQEFFGASMTHELLKKILDILHDLVLSMSRPIPYYILLYSYKF